MNETFEKWWAVQDLDNLPVNPEQALRAMAWRAWSRNEYPIHDYRDAPSGYGPLANTWKDKPHRLVYDLCRWVERLGG